MSDACIFVAVILFVIATVSPVVIREGPGWLGSSLVALGLAFFAASFVVPAA